QSWRDGNSLTRVNCTIVIFPVKRSVRGGLGGSGKEYIGGNLIPPVPTGEAINQAINEMQKRLAKMKRR
ncbi:MAG: hypothetical protein GY863_19445, partial [bacterium]|nr:hypothetical protein [bacterium]